MTLVQVSRIEGEVKRVPLGEQPSVDLHLKPNQVIRSIRFSQKIAMNADRKTVDWRYEAALEWRDPASETDEDTYPSSTEEGS
jgi:hypothetical protein